MKRAFWLLPLLVAGFIGLIAIRPSQEVAAQDDPVCQIQVAEALTTVAESCSTIGRNQVCYGNSTVEADLRPNVDAHFTESGDIIDVESVSRLTTSPFNSDTPEWGVALLRAQVNLPDALPGQNVTFLLYGDASLDNPTTDMRAVKLTTSVTEDVLCEDTPESALLVQAPRGTQVTLTLNGADIILGSTAYIKAEYPEMIVATVDGVVVVSAFGFIRVIQPGEEVFLPLDEEGNVEGGPSEVEPYNCEEIERSPLELLPEAVELPLCEGEPTAGTATPSPTRRAAATATRIPPTAINCTPRTDWQYTYVVVRGDTLSNIGSRIGVNPLVLAAGNCVVNPNIIYVGQVLRVPVPVPPRPVVTASFTPSLTPSVTVTVPTGANSQSSLYVSLPNN